MTHFFLSSADAKQPPLSPLPPVSLPFFFYHSSVPACRLARRRARTFRIFFLDFLLSRVPLSDHPSSLSHTRAKDDPKGRRHGRVCWHDCIASGHYDVGPISIATLRTDIKRCRSFFLFLLHTRRTRLSHIRYAFLRNRILPRVLESLCTNAHCIRCTGKEERSRGLP